MRSTMKTFATENKERRLTIMRRLCFYYFYCYCLSLVAQWSALIWPGAPGGLVAASTAGGRWKIHSECSNQAPATLQKAKR
ncbi:hypothetical protein PoB_002652300 [Plakobranchus ocellatus]|uniref:Uncharacterized protein n=1 Tax=Plakobranchus ocellatus TaxID=259542 RepID=A0AAV3ZZY6_9GAST|nr:hypothetical protein PoB_002652300 [Plakobranchus ocellatus]